MNAVKNANHDEMIPLRFRLSQNYPNPFKDKTIIKYCIAFRTNVNVSIFDKKELLIKNLIDKEQEAGTYELEFDASSLPEGIYYCRIKAGNYISTKKILLLK